MNPYFNEKQSIFRCENGWKGQNCSDCESLPGCINGKCENKPYTCMCDEGFTGHLCDELECM